MKYLLLFLGLFMTNNGFAQTDTLNTNVGIPMKGTAPFRTHCVSSLSKNNQPLIVVDGLPLNTETEKQYQRQIKQIDPQMIEKIEILRGDDPKTTAIYGARAVNGVILIKTKYNKKQRNQLVTNCNQLE